MCAIHPALNTVKEETFIFGAYEFDVRKAKIIITKKPRILDTVKVSLLEPYITRKTKEGKVFLFGVMVEDLPEHLEINLTVPLIWANLEGLSIPIDGWHRIKKALETGVAELPVYELTVPETRKCIIR